MGRPKILMLDEPFAALDGMLKDRLRDELLATQARHGVPFILITHDPDDLAACADAVVTLDYGSVVSVARLATAAGHDRAPLAKGAQAERLQAGAHT
jgi:molybdate transport system ATP-binding protein